MCAMAAAAAPRAATPTTSSLARQSAELGGRYAVDDGTGAAVSHERTGRGAGRFGEAGRFRWTVRGDGFRWEATRQHPRATTIARAGHRRLLDRSGADAHLQTGSPRISLPSQFKPTLRGFRPLSSTADFPWQPEPMPKMKRAVPQKRVERSCSHGPDHALRRL